MSAARVAASVAVALAALTACTSNAEPTPAPTPTLPASPSTSPSPSATPPTMPAEAEGTSPRAAKAFARHYIESVNFAMLTGDTSQLKKLASQSCRPCTAIVRGIEDAYVGGGHLEGDGWSIKESQYLRLSPDTALVGLSLNISKQLAYRTDQKTPTRSPATRGHLDIRLKRSQGDWLIFDMDATQ